MNVERRKRPANRVPLSSMCMHTMRSGRRLYPERMTHLSVACPPPSTTSLRSATKLQVTELCARVSARNTLAVVIVLLASSCKQDSRLFGCLALFVYLTGRCRIDGINAPFLRGTIFFQVYATARWNALVSDGVSVHTET